MNEEGFNEGVRKDLGEEALGGKGLWTVSAKPPFPRWFKRFLSTPIRKSRSDKEAKQISVQVSKYLHFASPVLDPKHLYDAQLLNRYMKTLEDQGKRPQHSMESYVELGRG